MSVGRNWYDEFYRDGQIDLLAAIEGRTHDEPRWVAIHERVGYAYGLWALGNNLVIAGALTKASQGGRS